MESLVVGLCVVACFAVLANAAERISNAWIKLRLSEFVFRTRTNYHDEKALEACRWVEECIDRHDYTRAMDYMRIAGAAIAHSRE